MDDEIIEKAGRDNAKALAEDPFAVQARALKLVVPPPATRDERGHDSSAARGGVNRCFSAL